MRSFALSRARDANYPGVFQDISQIVGEEAAAKLSAQYGGTRLYIPITLKTEHPLVQLLGQQTAQQLVDEFSAITVEIPRAFIRIIARRNELIIADRDDGMSQRQLAIKYQLTERTIRKITKSVSPVHSTTTHEAQKC